MLRPVNQILTGLFDVLLSPWQWESPWPGLLFCSLLAAGLFVALFRISSNQTILRRRRDQLLARVLELLIFRHDLRVSFSACGRIAVANGRYLAAFAVPAVVSIVPLFLLFVQFAAWFESRPSHINESLLVEIELTPEHPVETTAVSFKVSDDLQLELPVVRIPARNELCFAVRPSHPGTGWVQVEVGHDQQRREVICSDRLMRVAPQQHTGGWWNELWNPTIAPLPRNSAIIRFDIRYPPRQLLCGNFEVHWTIAACILIMLSGLLLGKLFGIRIA